MIPENKKRLLRKTDELKENILKDNLGQTILISLDIANLAREIRSKQGGK